MERGVTAHDVLFEHRRRRTWTCCRATSTCPAPRSSWSTRSAGSTSWAARSSRSCPDYDFILIDCQPSLGLLTINALACADSVLIPLECEYFAMRGVALLMETIDKVQHRLNPDLTIDGLLGTMYDSRTLHTREVLGSVVNGFGDKVFHTVINRTVRFPDATVAGEPITTFDSSSMGASSYRELAKEVLERWRQTGHGHAG